MTLLLLHRKYEVLLQHVTCYYMEMNLLVHIKYIRYMQHIIRLVHRNDMFVSTWKYQMLL